MHQKILPISDPKRKFIRDKGLSDAVSDFIKSGPYINGNMVEFFEYKFSEFLKVNYVCGVASGTSALQIALSALTLKPNSKVLVAPNCGGYAALAVLNNNLIPCYYDVDLNGLANIEILQSMDLDQVSAIIITHLYGQTANVAEIIPWARNNNLKVIEDCAQSVGSIFDNQRSGTFADIGVFSFYPTKNLSTIGDAGAICTNDLTYYTNCKLLRQYGWAQKYNSKIPGLNHRLDALHALVLIRQLDYLDQDNENRRNIWLRYKEALDGYGIRLIGEDNKSFVAHLAIIEVENRSEIQNIFANYSISTDIHFPYLDAEQQTFMRFKSQNTDTAKKLAQKILTIPLFPLMESAEIERVIDVLNIIRKFQ